MKHTYSRFASRLFLTVLVGFGVACSSSHYQQVGNSGLSAGKEELSNCQRGDASMCLFVTEELGNAPQARPFALKACELTTGKDAAGAPNFGNCIPAWEHFDSYNPAAQRVLIDKAWALIQTLRVPPNYSQENSEVKALELKLMNLDVSIACGSATTVVHGYCAGLAYKVAAHDSQRNLVLLNDLLRANCQLNGVTFNCALVAGGDQVAAAKAQQFETALGADVAERQAMAQSDQNSAGSEGDYNRAVAGAVVQGLSGAANTLAYRTNPITPTAAPGNTLSSRAGGTPGAVANLSATCESQCLPLKTACEGQPAGQSACYRAAACTCRCFLQHDTRPPSPQVQRDHQQWQQCVAQNHENAQSLK